MDGLNVVVLLGLLSGSFGSELKMPVKPGDNITLFCDCKRSSGVFIVWFRNCSHTNQPSLVLRTHYAYDPSYLTQDDFTPLSPFPNLHLVQNVSSNTYDLLIVNVSESEEGLYYCETEKKLRFSSCGSIVTRVLLNSTRSHEDIHQSVSDCGSFWKLPFSLCPTCAVLSAILSSLLVHYHHKKKDEQLQDVSKDNRGQDEDVCYAAVGIHQASKRLNMKKAQVSDCTYSAINTSRV